MTLSIVDTHAHLDMHNFDKDRSEVIARAIAAGVSIMVNPAVGLKSAQKIIRLSESNSHIFAAVGFHPHYVSEVTETDVKSLAKLVPHPRVVAIGETGLDFYRNLSPRETQIQIFKLELGLAAELKLPIIIHCREAEKETLTLLQNWVTKTEYPEGQGGGVIHCFSSDSNTLREYLDMGFYVSIGGYLTYPTSTRLYDIMKEIPDDRLMLETDAPFLPPQPYRGGRNEPAYMTLTLELLAKVRGVTPETLAKRTTENARRLFHLPEIEW